MSRTRAKPDVTGLVLAGGRSTRFEDTDANKATARLGSRTLLGRVVDAVTAATGSPPVVAVRTPTQRAAYETILAERDVSFAFDAPAYEGPLAGVFGAVKSLDAPWLFCCGCDMPLLSPAAIEWLVDRLADVREGSTDSPDALAVRHSDGVVEPMHTLYRRSALERAGERVSTTDGPRALLEAFDSVRMEPVDAAPADVPVEASVTNVNTRDDLDAISRYRAVSRDQVK